MALPPALEDVFQEMERRAKEACEKIGEAAKVIEESGDIPVDFEDPSVVRHVEDLRHASMRTKASTQPPVPLPTLPAELPEGTPPKPPRLVRPPRRPPSQS